jgi:hypothetical protein
LTRAHFWAVAEIPPAFDVAKLRPPSLPAGERFETANDCRELSRKREKKARKRLPEYSDGLARCDQRHPCGRPYCPKCARQFRRWLSSEALALLNGRSSGARIATIWLADIPEGQLSKFVMGTLHARLRQRIIRQDLRGVAAIGGTELKYAAGERLWIAHVHLLVFKTDTSIRRAIKKCADHDEDRAVVIQRIRDPVKQISYLQKFATYHRPEKARKRPPVQHFGEGTPTPQAAID